MNLDRGLIKKQARQLIKGKFLKLFLTYVILSLCMSLIMGIGSLISGIAGGVSFASSGFGDAFDFSGGSSDEDHFDDFDFSEEQHNFENFGVIADGGVEALPADRYVIGEENNTNPVLAAVSTVFIIIGWIAMILFIPATVTLAGYFVLFIRGKEFDLDGSVRYVFKGTFNKTYGKKLGLIFLIGLFTYLWSLLFVIPGIVFAYGARFAPQIMCDNPDIGPYQAIKLSQRITKGNKGELFVLDLSFIPWNLLCAITGGIAYFYVYPYIETTHALYYENFRLRALQQGRVTEDDFLSDEQRAEKYMNNPFTQSANQYYTPENAENAASQNAYYNPASPASEPPTDEAPAEEPSVQAEQKPPAQDFDFGRPSAAEEASADEIPTVEAENVTDEFE